MPHDPPQPSPEIIRVASGASDFRAFAQLIGEYVVWLRARYGQEDAFVTEVLDRQSLATEMEHLSTRYGAPNGRAFVAVCGDEVRGCGAYRRLDDDTCEMKRVFVPDRFRGSGIGRALCRALIASARAEGFGSMKLDTGRLMVEAIALYQSVGFTPCAAYAAYPQTLMPSLIFMELQLADPAASPRGA